MWKQDHEDCKVSNRTYISHIYNKVYPSCPTYRASGIHLFLFISLSLKYFPINPCFFQKKSVSLHPNSINPLKLEVNMEIKDNARKENFFLKLIEIKKEIRNCVQNGGNLHQIEKQYGIRFSKPL